MQQEPNQGGFIRNGQMNLQAGSETLRMSIYDFALKGIHNQYNTMAAGLAAVTIGIRKDKIREAVQKRIRSEKQFRVLNHWNTEWNM